MCTAIQLDYKNSSVVGRTMDFEHPLDYNPIYLPANYNYGKDLDGQDIILKYPILGLCFSNNNPLKDGINPHGLVGITNDFRGNNVSSKELVTGKINISSLDFLSYILGSYEKVEDIKKDIDKFNFALYNYKGDKVIAPDFHYMFVDKYQESIIVEARKGSLDFHDNKYKVMTNSPKLSSHIRRLKKTIDLDELESFNSSKDLPGAYDPVSRFIKAFYLTKTNVEPKDSLDALGHAYRILAALTLPEGFIKNKVLDSYIYTRYTVVYSIEDRLLSFKTEKGSQVYSWSFDDIKDKDKRQAFFPDMDFKMVKIKNLKK